MEAGVRVSRQAAGAVISGTAYGGSRCIGQPPPHREELPAAFVGQRLESSPAADIELSTEGELAVRRWFGAR